MPGKQNWYENFLKRKESSVAKFEIKITKIIFIKLHNIFFVQGKAISFAESFFGAGTIFGPSLGELLYEMGGFQTPFFVADIFHHHPEG